MLLVATSQRHAYTVVFGYTIVEANVRYLKKSITGVRMIFYQSGSRV